MMVCYELHALTPFQATLICLVCRTLLLQGEQCLFLNKQINKTLKQKAYVQSCVGIVTYSCLYLLLNRPL